jgi:hypothetical protein
MNNNKLMGRASLNALGVMIYVYLVSLLLSNGQNIFGTMAGKVAGPMLFLMLFVFSALVTGYLVLGKSVTLYLDGAKKDSLKLLFYTGVDLLALWAAVFVFLFLTK